MFEPTGAPRNVDEIMYEIREAVARQNDGVARILPALDSNHTPGETGSLSLQPPFQPRRDHHYQINDLLRFHGAEFVRNSYRALLLREPDEIGMAQYLEALGTGRLNKIDVLTGLHLSPEGRQSGVKLSGLAMPSAFRRLGRIPLIGYLVRLMTGVARLPLMLKHQSQLEFYLFSQLERVVEDQNQFRQDVRNELSQISTQILEGIQRSTEQKQAIDLSLEQYQHLFTHQAQLRNVIEDGLAKSRDFDLSSTKAIEQVTSETKQLVQQLQTLVQQQEDLLKNTEELKSELQSIGSEVQSIVSEQQGTNTALRAQEERLAVLLDQVTSHAPVVSNDTFTQLAAQERAHLLDSFYAAFEDQFRGDSDEVQRRLEVYIPFLKDAQISEDVLDLGCGRGEWLQLLDREGIAGKGLDRNRIFVDQCRRAGLTVVEAEASQYLCGLADSSLNCVTAFHLVEHLPFIDLIRLLGQVFRVLRPGGLAILETPNPENFIVGSCNFYTDPTHRNPIPNQTLQFFLESRGFEIVNVLKLRPLDEAKVEGDSELIRRFNEFFYSAPDYGVIATKPNFSP
jgi:SAM-dependent methyltransferase